MLIKYVSFLISRHFKRQSKKAQRDIKNFPNYILAELNPLRPFQVVVTDMTAFWLISITMNLLFLWIYLTTK